MHFFFSSMWQRSLYSKTLPSSPPHSKVTSLMTCALAWGRDNNPSPPATRHSHEIAISKPQWSNQFLLDKIIKYRFTFLLVWEVISLWYVAIMKNRQSIFPFNVILKFSLLEESILTAGKKKKSCLRIFLDFSFFNQINQMALYCSLVMTLFWMGLCFLCTERQQACNVL